MDKKNDKIKELDKLYDENKIHRLERPIDLSKKLISLVVLVAIISGLIAGILGGFLILVTRKIKLPFGIEYDLEKLLPKYEVAIETVKNVTVTADENRVTLSNNFPAQMVMIFNKKTSSKNILDQAYLENEIIGQGIVLTSDGWIITSRAVLESGISTIDKSTAKSKKITTEKIVMANNGTFYAASKVFFDPLTDLAFVKIEAQGLTVAKLAEKENVKPGERVVVFSGADLIETNINKVNYNPLNNKSDLIRSNEVFKDFILLSQTAEKFLAGSAVVGFDNSIIGLIKNNHLVTPIFYAQKLILQVLKSGSSLTDHSYLIRPYLGADFLDFSETKGISDGRYVKYRQGALIYGAPEKNSPAEIAGLKNGDIILKVNNDNINENNNLFELINQYEPKTVLEFLVQRADKEEKLKIILGEFKK